MRFRSIVVFLLALLVAAGAFYRWWRPVADFGEHEKEIVIPPAAETPPLPSPSPVAAPALSEVQPALDRVFDRTLTLDQATPRAFLAGDFNGDGATDLAVAVRPRDPDVLPRLNAELTEWSVQDATAATEGKPEPVTLAAGDRLLAVIHGVDGDGWRNPDARQGYLVKNALASGLRLRPLAGVPLAIRMKVPRTHIGDVIVQRRGGKPGMILWTGAAYVWSDL